MSTGAMRLRNIFVFSVRTVTVCAVAFVVVEGTSSTMLLLYEGFNLPARLFPSNYVTIYDDLLGWTNAPNSRAKGTFGPDTRVTINSQSFRAESDYSFEVPPRKLRIICSGDSFAFGSEVTDQDTWCHQLTLVDRQIETINMGVGGYGIDQSYLRYQRDGRPFQHDIHLFTFITEDFRRMQNAWFGVYGKPTLRLNNGTLAVKDVPVLKQSYFVRLLVNFSKHTEGLRSIELGKAILSRIWDPTTPQREMSDEEIRSMTNRVFDELQRLNREKQSILVLVYLPIATDYFKRDSNAWRRYVRAAALERRIPFLDVVEKFRSLPAEDVEGLYVRPWDGHFSSQGNKYLARFLHEQLSAVPQLAVSFRKRSLK